MIKHWMAETAKAFSASTIQVLVQRQCAKERLESTVQKNVKLDKQLDFSHCSLREGNRYLIVLGFVFLRINSQTLFALCFVCRLHTL